MRYATFVLINGTVIENAAIMGADNGDEMTLHLHTVRGGMFMVPVARIHTVTFAPDLCLYCYNTVTVEHWQQDAAVMVRGQAAHAECQHERDQDASIAAHEAAMQEQHGY